MPHEIAALPASYYQRLLKFFDFVHAAPPSDDEQDGIDVDQLIDSGRILGDPSGTEGD